MKSILCGLMAFWVWMESPAISAHIPNREMFNRATHAISKDMIAASSEAVFVINFPKDIYRLNTTGNSGNFQGSNWPFEINSAHPIRPHYARGPRVFFGYLKSKAFAWCNNTIRPNFEIVGRALSAIFNHYGGAKERGILIEKNPPFFNAYIGSQLSFSSILHDLRREISSISGFFSSFSHSLGILHASSHHTQLPPKQSKLGKHDSYHYPGQIDHSPFSGIPITRRIITAIICSGVGVSFAIWSVERFATTRPRLCNFLSFLGLLVFALGLLLWWLTFAYRDSWTWWL